MVSLFRLPIALCLIQACAAVDAVDRTPADEPDVSVPDSVVSNGVVPDGVVPDGVVPGSVVSDSVVPGRVVPDGVVSDGVVSDAARPGPDTGADAVEAEDSGPAIFDPWDKRPVAPPCAKELAPAFELLVQPHIVDCANCHDSTIPASWMPHGGPQWFDPANAEATVTLLLDKELLDPESPPQSPLIQKPLSTLDGGTKHAGGNLFSGGSPPILDLTKFAVEAADCLNDL